MTEQHHEDEEACATDPVRLPAPTTATTLTAANRISPRPHP
ncbi:hypothetical protein AB0L65_61895 [Nonomuraea sp. NPDC052116]